MTKTIYYASTAHPRDELRVHLKQINSLLIEGFEVKFLVCDGLGYEKRTNLEIIDFGKSNSRFSRFFIKPLQMLIFAKRRKARTFHFHDPEFLLPIIFMSRKIYTIYDCHEDVLGSISHRRWIPRWSRGAVFYLFRLVEKISFRKLSFLITATESIAEIYKFKNSLVINNYPFLSEFENIDKDFSDEVKSACYVGTLSLERGIVNCVLACSDLGIELHVAGWFSDHETQEVLESMPEWDNVVFHGSISRKEVKEIYSNVDFGMVLFKALPNHVNSQPNKLFEYFSAGLPVICSDFPKWKTLVDDNHLGICCNPDDIDEIKKAIYNLRSHYIQFKGEGRKYIHQSASWEIEQNKLINFYLDMFK